MTIDSTGPFTHNTSTLHTKGVNSFMEKDQVGTPPTGVAKKQTSLLSFFSSPSLTPKRQNVIQDDEEGFMEKNDNHHHSPSKKKIREKDNVAVDTDSMDFFYEMASDDENNILEPVEPTNASKPKNHARTAPLNSVEYEDSTLAPSGLDFTSFALAEEDSSVMDVIDPLNSLNSIVPCRESKKIKNLLDDESTNGRDEGSGSADRYPWLVNVKDGEGRTFDDPNYNPRTLFIPKSAWSRFTPFEKQYWEIKKDLFDTMVFFKKGKFYELYEKDADIGAREFDLKMIDRVNMRMVGVPEASFEMWTARFIANGHKIARVDQTETAVGKSIREKEGNKDKSETIIRRELSCILTAGTITEPSMINSDAGSYCVSLKERGEGNQFGLAILEASTGSFQFANFSEDSTESRSLLETSLIQLQPKELLIEKGRLSAESKAVIKRSLPNVLITEAIAEKEFLTPQRTFEIISSEGYFVDNNWPLVLERLRKDECAAFDAFGALVWYLRTLKLDKALLSYQNYSIYDPLKQGSSMVIDGPSLINLDIVPHNLRSSSSSSSLLADPKKGTLLSVIDHCSTAFGKRQLMLWLCHPLRDADHINARLDVVDYLISNTSLASSLRNQLQSIPDLERAISRIHSGSIKLKDFINAIDAFARILRLKKELLENGSLVPTLLLQEAQSISDYADTIDYFINSFDKSLALREGKVIPFPGVSKEYDAANEKFAAIETSLQEYRRGQEKALKVREIKFRDLGKEIFQLEVPADTPVPREYEIRSKTKTCKRYWTPTIRSLVRDYAEWEERRSAILKGIFSSLLANFTSYNVTWRGAVKAVASIDCLLSLAKASELMSFPKCRPNVFTAKNNEALLDAADLRHPCTTDPNFIPNDINLGERDASGEGGETDRVMLLTGPNMGGKSTLLRQVCLAVILAQLGCYVTASKCNLTPIDRIFTRLGANDNIMAGKSTFMMELLDTAKILNEATSNSLVILDELGRGTSTFDGMAIAHAVLLNLLRTQKSLTLFATHYRPLAVDCLSENGVQCRYMDCAVDPDGKRVTFLYKLVPGVSPKSYGMNVAIMAGVPKELIDEAEQVAEEFETRLSLSLEDKGHGLSRLLSRALINQVLCPRQS